MILLAYAELLACCVTCLYSDYSPGGHGLTGIRCHRGAKEQYLAVRKKADYWSVPSPKRCQRPTCAANTSAGYQAPDTADRQGRRSIIAA
jgi:hypothetical protein